MTTDQPAQITDEQVEKIRAEFVRSGCDTKELHDLCNQASGAKQMRAELARLRDALSIILPMAKGYAAEHQVGNNQRMVDEAADALIPFEEQP